MARMRQSKQMPQKPVANDEKNTIMDHKKHGRGMKEVGSLRTDGWVDSDEDLLQSGASCILILTLAYFS